MLSHADLAASRGEEVEANRLPPGFLRSCPKLCPQGTGLEGAQLEALWARGVGA